MVVVNRVDSVTQSEEAKGKQNQADNYLWNANTAGVIT